MTAVAHGTEARTEPGLDKVEPSGEIRERLTDFSLGRTPAPPACAYCGSAPTAHEAGCPRSVYRFAPGFREFPRPREIVRNGGGRA